MTISAPIQRGVKRPLVGVLVLPEGNIKQGASAYGMNIVTALSLFFFFYWLFGYGSRFLLSLQKSVVL